MRHLINQLKHWWYRRQYLKQSQAPLPPPLVKSLLEQTAITAEDDYACVDCDQLIDQFTEALARGEPAAKLMPQVQKHLDMCGYCHEEFEALLRILKAEQKLS
ncbi:MAG TPA: hypothetical protein VLL52_07715 [Anaerolineae bacterium]|nr:hypothetical protein [Anaerolineae bacterium]